jgi:hypothetical protein
MSQQVTKPHFVDIQTRRGAWPPIYWLGIKQPQPMHQVSLVNTAGYGAPKRDLLNNKEVLDKRPVTYKRLDPADPLELHPAYRSMPPKGANHSWFDMNTAHGFH